MALSKIFTVGTVVNTVLLWLREEMQNDLEPNIVISFANLAVLEEAEKISVVSDDYGKTVEVTETGTNVSSTVVTGANYDNASKQIAKMVHGLTTTDIGKRIILYSDAPRMGIFHIESITDEDNFVIDNEFGIDIIDNSLSYVVLSEYSTSVIDISAYKIMNIVKLHSSVLKEIKKLGDIEADNIERNDFKRNNAYWTKHGEKIYLVIPSGVNLGTTTLFYNTYPEKKTSLTDYFDIRDIYIPQVIKRTKKMCMEYLGIIQHGAMDGLIESKSEQSNIDATNRKASINTENRTAVDG